MDTRFVSTALLAALILCSPVARSAEGSYKDWRNAMKAAEQARFARDFQKMREILEAAAPNALKQGALSSAENSLWLSFAYQQLNLPDLALETFNKEIDRIGPKPTAVKLQVIRGLLLIHRGVLLYESRKYDEAMKSAEDGKAALEDVAGKYHPELYQAHMIIGRVDALRKHYAEAEKSMRMALKLAQSKPSGIERDYSGDYPITYFYVGNPAAHRVILASGDLGEVLLLEKKYADAADVFNTGVKAARAAYPKESIMQVLPLRGLARAEFELGKRKEFLKDTDQIYEILTKLQGLEPSSVNPIWLKFHADVTDGNAIEAEATLRKIEKLFAAQNFDFPELPHTAMSIASVNGQVDWKRAELIQNVLTKIADGYGPSEAGKAGAIFVEIASFAAANGKPKLAESIYERTLKSQENAKDKGLLISVLGKMAENKIAAGNKSEALPLLHRVSVALREKYGNDMRVADAMDTEAALMKELGQEQPAADLKAEAMALRKKAAGL